MGGSSVLVIAGIWLAVLGYAVLYTGVAKTSGDSSYHLALAFQGQTPNPPSTASTSSSGQGGASRGAGWQQHDLLPWAPIS